jgi:small subunit ribosomal protein S6
MMRKYEIVYIFDSALEESEIDQILDTQHELLKTPSSPEPVTATSHWGKRTLAYEVKSKSVGYYVVARLETEPSALTEFERRIKLEDRILRYLIVVDEGFKPLLSPAEAEAASEASADRPVDAEAKPAAAVVKEDE